MGSKVEGRQYGVVKTKAGLYWNKLLLARRSRSDIGADCLFIVPFSVVLKGLKDIILIK